jgi:hypothetical protein
MTGNESAIPPGGGIGMVVELAVQEAIVLGLHTLASDERAINELVGYESELRHSSSQEWRAALRDALLQMVDGRSDMYCDVRIGYPSPPGEAKLPAISIVMESGGENEAEATIGDVLHVGYSGLIGPRQELYETTVIGSGQTTTLQIGAWATAPERSTLLIAAVKWALYQQKDRMIAKGIHEISLSESGVEISPDLEPRVGYMPTIIARINWTFRLSSRRRVPNRVTLARGNFST